MVCRLKLCLSQSPSAHSMYEGNGGGSQLERSFHRQGLKGEQMDDEKWSSSIVIRGSHAGLAELDMVMIRLNTGEENA